MPMKLFKSKSKNSKKKEIETKRAKEYRDKKKFQREYLEAINEKKKEVKEKLKKLNRLNPDSRNREIYFEIYKQLENLSKNPHNKKIIENINSLENQISK